MISSSRKVSAVQLSVAKLLVYRSTTQNIAQGTDTTIVWDTVVTDSASSYNISTGEYTAPNSGWCILTSSAELSEQLASISFFIKVNGNNYYSNDNYTQFSKSSNNNYSVGKVAMAFPVVSGDVLKMTISNAEGVDVTLENWDNHWSLTIV